MKSYNQTSKNFNGGLLAVILCLLTVNEVHAQIYVSDIGNGDNGAGSIGEYSISGGSGNSSLVSGLTNPYDIAVVGSDVFVAFGTKISEYNTSGDTVSSSFVSGLHGADYIAASGSDLFVTQSFPNGTAELSEYNTSGGVVNPSISLPTGSGPSALATSGSNIFVVDYATGTIGEYTTSLTLVNAALFTDNYLPEYIAASATDLYVSNGGDGYIFDYSTSGTLLKTNLLSSSLPISALAVSGSDLFVLSSYVGYGTVGEYTTSGSVVNASLVAKIPGYEYGIALEAAPEPSMWAMLTFGLCLLVFWRVRISRSLI